MISLLVKISGRLVTDLGMGVPAPVRIRPMTYVADLHLHSPYAIGTSNKLTFENLARWARIKGIDLLASADFTHPAWFEETRAKLHDDGDGLFTYDGARFVLGTELSCVAPQDGRSRRVHMLVFAPSVDTVTRINAALASRGRLERGGRAIFPRARATATKSRSKPAAKRRR